MQRSSGGVDGQQERRHPVLTNWKPPRLSASQQQQQQDQRVTAPAAASAANGHVHLASSLPTQSAAAGVGASGRGRAAESGQLAASAVTSPSKLVSSAKDAAHHGQFWRSNHKLPGMIRPVADDGERPAARRLSQGSISRTQAHDVVSGGLASSDVRPPQGTALVGPPVNVLQRSFSAGAASSQATSGAPLGRDSPPTAASKSDDSRVAKFQQVLDADVVDLEALKALAWKGIPDRFRALTWKLLLEYVPSNRERRAATVARKRAEYAESIAAHWAQPEDSRSPEETALFRQIQIDVPRTNPTIPLFQSEVVQQCLARVLYVWAIRHPASGYVQGINDLATPFFIVFLQTTIPGATEAEVERWDIGRTEAAELQAIEADMYWCLTKLLDGIQDNYTFAQPGIQRMLHTLSELIHRIDAPLHEHLQQQDVQFTIFAFRWINCLLMRELPIRLIIRMWDTYFAEPGGFAAFHIYTCAAFLMKFSDQLKQLDFQDIMLFLKTPPTAEWTESDVELILSQAYMWFSLFRGSPKHLQDDR